MSKFYHSIPYKFAMFILIFFIIVMATAGYTAYVGAKEVILNDKSESIVSISMSTEYLIKGWYHEQFSKVGRISSNPFVINNIERIVHDDENDAEYVNKSYAIITRYLTSMITDDHDVVGLTIVDVEGNALVSTSISNYGAHNTYNLQEGLNEETVQYIIDDPKSNSFQSDISMPIEVNGTPIAMIIAHLDCVGIVPFTTGINGIGDTGIIQILNPQSYAESQSRRIMTAPTSSENSIKNATPMPTYGMKKAFNKENGVEIYKNTDGNDVIGSFRWIDDIGAAIIIEVDADEVLQPINDLKTKMLINILALMLFFSALTLMVVSNTIRSIKKLKHSAEKIASGDLSSRVNITRKDEIGELANAFNSMTRNLDTMAGKLIDSKSRFEAVFEHANIGILVLDANGHIIMINSWTQKRWGKCDGKISYYEYITGKRGTEADEKTCIGIAAITKGEIQTNNEVHTKTGLDHTYMEAASPIWDADGNCTGAVIIISDVTDSTKAKARLEFTAKIFSKTKDFIDLKPTVAVFLKTITEYSKCDSIAIRLKDSEDYPYYLWQGMEDKTAVTESSLLCKDTNGNDKQALEYLCDCVMNGRAHMLSDHITAEGSFWSNDISILDEYQTNDATGTVIRNKCGKSGYRSLALIPVRHKDATLGLIQLNYRHPNRLTLDDIHYYESIAETVGITIDNSKLYEHIKNLADDLEKKIGERTEELASANDELVAMNEEFVAMNEELVSANEESAQMNEELTEANNRLREVDRLKSEFLNTMSHELRTPLTSIIGYSSLLMQKIMGGLTTKQEEYADGILRSGNHLLALINEILDLSKIEAGMMNISAEKVDALPIIEDVVISHKPMIVTKGHTVEMDIAEDMYPIYVDKIRLKQILMNLVSNAIKFTDDGGHIIIRSYHKDGNVNIDVVDNGIGIMGEDIKKLFKKFSQVDQKLSRKYEGTGLGLAIVKEFTELMDGKIYVESIYGEGSIFRLVFPPHIETP